MENGEGWWCASKLRKLVEVEWALVGFSVFALYGLQFDP
jgi:hypothetical protein